MTFTAVVEHAGSPLGTEVVRRLEQLGATVEALTDWDRHGEVDAYVHLGPWSEPPVLAPLAALDEDWFDAAFQQPFEELVWSLHAGYAHLRKPGGRVVVVVPTIAMAGAPGLAATAAAAEGQRLLVKAAARQWGAEGIVMNIVAADLRALAAGAIDLPPVSLSPPALGEARVTDLAAVARAIGALASDGEATVTGATVIVDGGTWMAP